MSKSYSYKDWVETPAKEYEISREDYEKIAAKADELVDLCEALGYPAVFIAQVCQRRDGAYKFLSAGFVSDPATVCAPLLAIGSVARGSDDIIREAEVAIGAHSRKFGEAEDVDTDSLVSILEGIGLNPRTLQ